MLSKYPSNFQYDINKDKIVTKEEWELRNANKELSDKVALL